MSENIGLAIGKINEIAVSHSFFDSPPTRFGNRLPYVRLAVLLQKTKLKYSNFNILFFYAKVTGIPFVMKGAVVLD